LDLSFDLLAILIVLAPFGAAALAPIVSKQGGIAAGWVLAIIPAGMFVIFFGMLGDVAAGHVQRFAVDWVPSLGLSLSFLIDGLSLTFALLITGIGAIIVVYSGTYLAADPRRGYFLSIILLFMGSMLGLVLSNSLVALFAFWELTTVTSFLLIGFDRERVEARRAAIQALIVTAIGGLSLLTGGVLLYLVGGTWNIDSLMRLRGPLSVDSAYPWVLGFILVAAFTKSAQVPFHFWLPRAMEAPTPVSAYLHSATMVQAGVYLLARMSPLLGGTSLWTGWLTIVGGITLLWGAAMALTQTDIKQILAQTTIASLGLLVLLLGIGGEAAAMAVAAYFVAHALYKAALFLVAGLIEKETGTRDITALGGLRDQMTISFIATGLAALSMFGLPPFIGWFAKEETYADIAGDPGALLTIVVLVLGNALIAAIAIALIVRPFFGADKSTPQPPHEGPFGMWLGPVILGLVGFSVVFVVATTGELLLGPMASAIFGHKLESHLALAVNFADPALWLSVLTWAIAGLVYWQFDRVRALLARLDRSCTWTFDKGFDQVYFGIVRFSGFITRTLHHGRVELYVGIVFVSLALILLVPLWTLRAWPGLPAWPALAPVEWAVVALAAVGVIIVVVAPSRLFAIVALGLQGLAVALLFVLFGAPDLGFTQLMVEMLSVVFLALVITRLNLNVRDPRPLEDLARDGTLALVIGVAATAVLLKVLERAFDPRLGAFFAANSAEIAHGRNIVNVILVDFRGLDTLGEISVVMGAGIAILTLIRRQKRTGADKAKPVPREETGAA
jgi:multicomponent Na+:H+ antiporter subunit A